MYDHDQQKMWIYPVSFKAEFFKATSTRIWLKHAIYTVGSAHPWQPLVSKQELTRIMASCISILILHVQYYWCNDRHYSNQAFCDVKKGLWCHGNSSTKEPGTLKFVHKLNSLVNHNLQNYNYLYHCLLHCFSITEYKWFIILKQRSPFSPSQSIVTF